MVLVNVLKGISTLAKIRIVLRFVEMDGCSIMRVMMGTIRMEMGVLPLVILKETINVLVEMTVLLLLVSLSFSRYSSDS